jgi:hypothetical protein
MYERSNLTVGDDDSIDRRRSVGRSCSGKRVWEARFFLGKEVRQVRELSRCS